MAPFVIVVDLVVDGNNQKHAVPRPIPNPMHVGDTVQYQSSDGLVTVEFNDLDLSPAHSNLHSPFADSTGKEITVVTSTDGAVPVRNKGKFFCRCFITLPGPPPDKIGWSPKSPGSGGNHEVK